MTKKKSHADTLPPAAAEEESQPIVLSGAHVAAEMEQPPAAPEPQQFVGVFDPTIDPPKDDAGDSEALEPTIEDVGTLLQASLDLLSEKQHSDFTGQRHRAMQLITEARSLLTA